MSSEVGVLKTSHLHPPPHLLRLWGSVMGVLMNPMMNSAAKNAKE